MGKSLGLQDDSVALTQEVMTRIQRAQLTNIRIDWGNQQVVETYPAKLPELWAGRPVIVFGRYGSHGAARLTVRGEVEGEAVSWPLDVEFPVDQPAHDVLAKVWARKKIESLMHSTFYQGSPAVEEEVTALALDYRLMSPYTSFVAVDVQDAEKVAGQPQPPRRMPVAVPLPEGTRWEGFFGEAAGEIGQEVDEVRLWFVPAETKEAAPAPARGKVRALSFAGRSARPSLGVTAGRFPSAFCGAATGRLDADGCRRGVRARCWHVRQRESSATAVRSLSGGWN